jgi:hypothetical protein
MTVGRDLRNTRRMNLRRPSRGPEEIIPRDSVDEARALKDGP